MNLFRVENDTAACYLDSLGLERISMSHPLTILSRCQRAADKLPVPCSAGVWIKQGQQTFITTEKDGALAWEACEEGLKPSKLGFRFCAVHLSPDNIKQPSQPNYP